MKKLVLLLSLSGCANLQFNHEEYQHLVSIQFDTQKLKASCGSLSQKRLDNLKDEVHMQNLFAASLIRRSDIQEASDDLEQILNPLTTSSSKAYCKDKLDNLEQATQKTLRLEADRY